MVVVVTVGSTTNSSEVAGSSVVVGSAVVVTTIDGSTSRVDTDGISLAEVEITDVFASSVEVDGKYSRVAIAVKEIPFSSEYTRTPRLASSSNSTASA